MAASYHPSGFAGPLIYIFDGAGNLLKNRFGSYIHHEAISFEYEYVEGEDDTCTIIIQTKDRFLPDNKALQIDSALAVQWGYNVVGGGKILSPKRLIAIRDTETQYAADSIKLKLKCTDRVSYIKEIQNNDIRKGHFIDWLSEVVQGKYKANLLIHTTDIVQYNDKRPDLIKTTEGKFGNVTLARENTAIPMTAQFFETKVLKGQSKAIHAAILDELKFAEGGPFHFDTRDEEVTIANKDFNQPASYSFSYAAEPADIITFTPKTNYQANAVENAEIASVGAENKTVNKTTSNYVSVLETQGGDAITIDGNVVPKELIDNYTTQVLAGHFNKLLENGNIVGVEEDEWNGNLEMIPDLEYSADINHHVNDYEAAQYDLDNAAFTAAKDNTAAPIDFLESVRIKIPAKVLLAMDEVQVRLEQLLQNEIVEREQHKHEADLVVIGNPYIETSKILSISGTANVHSGLWYITKARHKLTPQSGYTVDMELIKKPTASLVVEGKYTAKLQEVTKEIEKPRDLLTDEARDIAVKEYASQGKNPLLLKALPDDQFLETIQSENILDAESSAAFVKANNPEIVSSDNDKPASIQDKNAVKASVNNTNNNKQSNAKDL